MSVRIFFPPLILLFPYFLNFLLLLLFILVPLFVPLREYYIRLQIFYRYSSVSGEHILQVRLSEFTQPIAVCIHLVLIKVCRVANCTTRIGLHRVRNYSALLLVKY